MYKDLVFEYVKNRYGTDPEYLWEKDPESAVLRHANGKWYAVVMNVHKSRLGSEASEAEESGKAFILNVKCEPLIVDFMTRSKGFYHGYHMNKENWLTILLDGTVDKGTILEFIDKSYDNVSGNINRKEKTHA